MSDDIVAFIRARLTEDHARLTALLDAGLPSSVLWQDADGEGVHECLGLEVNGAKRYHRWWVGATTAEDATDWGWRMHDSAVVMYSRTEAERALRDVEAKRRVLAACTSEIEYVNHFDVYREYEPLSPDELLKILAAPYADHPDYRETWRP